MKNGDILAPPLVLGIDLACLGTARTGAGVYVRELVRALRGLPGVSLREFPPAGYPVRGGGPLGKIWNHARLFFWLQAELPRRARRTGCRVLLSPEYLAPRRGPFRRIVVVYDAAFGLRPAEYNRLWRVLFQSVYLPAIRSADAVVTITRTAKAELARVYGLAPERVHVIPPACDPERFRPAPRADLEGALRDVGLTPGGYFVHVGVMEKRKNLPRLVRAFARVAATEPDLKLVLAGQPGPKQDLNDAPRIEEEIRRLDLSGRVLLPGYLPVDTLPRLYQGARAMVFPTLYEGFGIPILEALASGTAVACSDLPVLREVAGEAAVYFDPASEEAIADSLRRLLREAPDARRAAGEAQVAKFSWTAGARALLDLARRLENPHA